MDSSLIQASHWALCLSSSFNREGDNPMKSFKKLDIVISNVLINKTLSKGKMGFPSCPLLSHLSPCCLYEEGNGTWGRFLPRIGSHDLGWCLKRQQNQQLVGRWSWHPVGDTNAYYQEKAENQGVGRKGKWGSLPYSFGTSTNMGYFS